MRKSYRPTVSLISSSALTLLFLVSCLIYIYDIRTNPPGSCFHRFEPAYLVPIPTGPLIKENIFYDWMPKNRKKNFEYIKMYFDHINGQKRDWRSIHDTAQKIRAKKGGMKLAASESDLSIQ